MSEFPVDVHLEQICEDLKKGETVLLGAEPGAGKTTRVPPKLSAEFPGRILVVEPRQVAAKLPATFIAKTLGEEVGKTVGYRVRFDHKASNDTKVLFLTDGMFLRLLESNKFLSDVSVVVFDEFHERSADMDLALALLNDRYFYRGEPENSYDESILEAAEHKPVRPALLIMSATLDFEAVKSYLPHAKSYEVEGRNFPIKTVYEKKFVPRDRRDRQPYLEVRIASEVSRILAGDYQKAIGGKSIGNILVFLCGKTEIQRVSEHLKREFEHTYDVIPMMSEYAGRSLEKINMGSRPKIICATNVAETSVTLPGIKFVIDGGQQFSQHFAPWNGLPFIRKEKIAQDRAIQRAGRAGRLGPGVCIRMYEEADFISRERFTTPELLRSDLTQSILTLVRFTHEKNIRRLFDRLYFVSPVDPESVESSVRTLEFLGLVKNGEATSLLSSLDLSFHPRIAVLLAKAAEMGIEDTGTAVAAILETGGFLKRGAKPYRYYDCDFVHQVGLLQNYLYKKGDVSTAKDVAKERLIQTAKLAERMGLRKTQRTKETEGIGGAGGPARQNFSTKQNKKHNKLKDKENADTVFEDSIKEILLAGFPDRVARVLPKFDKKQEAAKKKKEVFHGGEYVFTLGGAASLSVGASVQGEKLLLSPGAVEINDRRRRVIQLSDVTSLSSDFLIKHATLFLNRSLETEYDSRKNTWNKKEKVSYGEFILFEESVDLDDATLREALKKQMIENFPEGFEDSDFFSRYLNKVQFLNEKKISHEAPLFDEEFKQIFIDVLLDADPRKIYETPLEKHFEVIVGGAVMEYLKKACPDVVSAKNGTRFKIHWDDSSGPYVRAKIQEFYGLSENLKFGCHDLEVHRMVFTAPNDRDIQISSDIRSFFEKGYYLVMKDLKPRYPKHYWPDDPCGAKPVLLKRFAD